MLTIHVNIVDVTIYLCCVLVCGITIVLLLNFMSTLKQNFLLDVLGRILFNEVMHKIFQLIVLTLKC